jgi:hypothetical protein
LSGSAGAGSGLPGARAVAIADSWAGEAGAGGGGDEVGERAVVRAATRGSSGPGSRYDRDAQKDSTCVRVGVRVR